MRLTYRHLMPDDDPLERHEKEAIRDTVKQLFGIGVNSHDRLWRMLNETIGHGWRTFFPIFEETYSSCDATWHDRKQLLDALRCNHDERGWEPPGIRKLPEIVTVYRGCSRGRVRGVSWTTGRNVAERFAFGHRGIRVPNPVIASAIIPREHVFAVINNRSEKEVILDPKRLRQLKVEDFDISAMEAAENARIRKVNAQIAERLRLMEQDALEAGQPAI